jgi:hypothetical protein
MKLLPSKYHCDFRYTCDKCLDTHWVTQEEARIRGFKISCYCGSVIEIEAVEIKNVELRKVNSSQQKTTPLKKNYPLNTILGTPKELEDAIVLLKQFGYKKGEAETKATAVYKKGMTDEDIFKAAIST